MDELWLTVVSYPGTLERFFEEVTARMLAAPHERHRVERCQEPADLVWLARKWKRRGYRVTRLDLVGHGDGGRFKLGDELLFAAEGTGLGLARRLGPLLAPGAAVRLLGCRTATVEREPRSGRVLRSGRLLLRALERELRRGRTAWGTVHALYPAHFGPGGLVAAAEKRLVTAR